MPPSPLLIQLDTETDILVQLTQMNAHLMAQQAHLSTQLATANQLNISVLGASRRSTPSLDCRQAHLGLASVRGCVF